MFRITVSLTHKLATIPVLKIREWMTSCHPFTWQLALSLLAAREGEVRGPDEGDPLLLPGRAIAVPDHAARGREDPRGRDADADLICSEIRSNEIFRTAPRSRQTTNSPRGKCDRSKTSVHGPENGVCQKN